MEDSLREGMVADVLQKCPPFWWFSCPGGLSCGLLWKLIKEAWLRKTSVSQGYIDGSRVMCESGVNRALFLD